MTLDADELDFEALALGGGWGDDFDQWVWGGLLPEEPAAPVVVPAIGGGGGPGPPRYIILPEDIPPEPEPRPGVLVARLVEIVAPPVDRGRAQAGALPQAEPQIRQAIPRRRARIATVATARTDAGAGAAPAVARMCHSATPQAETGAAMAHRARQENPRETPRREALAARQAARGRRGR